MSLFLFPCLSPRQKGVLALLVIVICGSASDFLTQFVLQDYQKPFFTSYFSMFCLQFYLLFYFSFNAYKRNCKNKERPISYATEIEKSAPISKEEIEMGNSVEQKKDVDCSLAETEGEENMTTIGTEKSDPLPVTPYSMRETIKISLGFCFLYFLESYFDSVAFAKVSVSVATILSSTSSFFTLILAAICKLESFTMFKCFGVLIACSGVFVLGKEEYEMGTDATIGATAALLSAVSFGLYNVISRKLIQDENRLNPILFQGFLGFFNVLFLWPFLILLHEIKEEIMELPSMKTIGLLICAGFLCTSACLFMWHVAMKYASPLLVAIGLSLAIPMNMFLDWVIMGAVPDFAVSYAAGAVTLGFFFLHFADQYAEKEKKLWRLLRSKISRN